MDIALSSSQKPAQGSVQPNASVKSGGVHKALSLTEITGGY